MAARLGKCGSVQLLRSIRVDLSLQYNRTQLLCTLQSSKGKSKLLPIHQDPKQEGYRYTVLTS